MRSDFAIAASPAAAGSIAARVRDRLREDRIDPAREPGRVTEIVRGEVRRYNDFAPARGLEPLDDEEGCARHVQSMVTGFGPVQALLDDPTIEEIWINAPDRIFFARDGRAQRAPIVLTETAVRDLVERMLQTTGRRVDLSQPFADASLPDGSRLHVVIPDITRAHWSVNIRKFLPVRRTLADLVDAGALRPEGAALLSEALAAGRSILISGPTGAGNTTWHK